jgi:hypothetical protein
MQRGTGRQRARHPPSARRLSCEDMLGRIRGQRLGLRSCLLRGPQSARGGAPFILRCAHAGAPPPRRRRWQCEVRERQMRRRGARCAAPVCGGGAAEGSGKRNLAPHPRAVFLEGSRNWQPQILFHLPPMAPWVGSCDRGATIFYEYSLLWRTPNAHRRGASSRRRTSVRGWVWLRLGFGGLRTCSEAYNRTLMKGDGGQSRSESGGWPGLRSSGLVRRSGR